MLQKYIFICMMFVLVGCTGTSLIQTQKSFPEVYVDVNATHEKKRNLKVTLFRLHNYTDTPNAGLRASNILEGLLLAKGFKVRSHIHETIPSLKQARSIAKEEGSKYFMYGGISEWRYKTGIDGEPAVSIQCSLYKVKKGKLVWSATGSDSSWGMGSIGTTAQDLLAEMMSND